jgi:hypothetical protein
VKKYTGFLIKWVEEKMSAGMNSKNLLNDNKETSQISPPMIYN